MKKTVVICTVVTLALLFAGVGTFIAGLALAGWDFSRLGTPVTKESFPITESFDRISVSGITADVRIVSAGDAGARVDCVGREDMIFTVSVEDGCLYVTETESDENFIDFSFGFSSRSMTLYLPGTAYASLDVKLTTGDVRSGDGFTFDTVNVTTTTGHVGLSDVRFGQLSVRTGTGSVDIKTVSAQDMTFVTTTGDVRLTDVTCEGTLSAEQTTGSLNCSNVTAGQLRSAATTGDMHARDVTVSGGFNVERKTGDVSVNGLDSGSTVIRATTGDIRVTLLKPQFVSATSSTGDVDVEKTAKAKDTSAGLCEIATTTGDISVRFK